MCSWLHLTCWLRKSSSVHKDDFKFEEGRCENAQSKSLVVCRTFFIIFRYAPSIFAENWLVQFIIIYWIARATITHLYKQLTYVHMQFCIQLLGVLWINIISNISVTHFDCCNWHRSEKLVGHTITSWISVCDFYQIWLWSSIFIIMMSTRLAIKAQNFIDIELKEIHSCPCKLVKKRERLIWSERWVQSRCNNL